MIRTQTPIPTWFGVGGGADRLLVPESIEELQRALTERDSEEGPIRVLGDGANLLVCDDGVDGLVIDTRTLNAVEWGERTLRAQCGAKLPRLVTEACRRGLGGLEGLGGIPASVGGAVRMNAGGAFGQIADVVARVHVLDPSGNRHALVPDELQFGYRWSNLGGLIVVEVELTLTPDDPETLRSRLKEVMAHKKDAQPLADRSAGCVFKNPEVDGERVGAGRLIDKAGLKGERIGGASVSERHGNFIVVEDGATAADVIALIERVRTRVREHCGVELEQEVVVWRRGERDE